VTTAEVAGLIVAITGAAAALFAGLRNLRGDRFNRDVSSSAALLTGYKDMVQNLREELDAVRRSLAEERQQWAQERRELHDEIDELRESIDRMLNQQRRSPDARTRRTDHPEV
jgi:septal ring factor EnvC (AmiA/AmiB activator)